VKQPRDASTEPVPALSLDSWRYAELFEPLTGSSTHSVVDRVEAYVESVELQHHPFFAQAAVSKSALTLWVSQELVMTNAFSQLVMYAASRITNVHARAVLAEVAYGEHGRAKRGLAKASHPWLLNQLRDSIGLSTTAVKPEKPTRDFIQRLASGLHSPLASIAFIGVGNERLIVPEYEALRSCFQELWPTANFEPFLQANLTEDITHSRLCYELASMLIRTDEHAIQFEAASRASVDSRVQYFDDLLALTAQGTAQSD
jgi:hypothetical protein